MSTQSIRAEVATTILESGQNLLQTRQFIPGIDGQFANVWVDGQSIVIPVGGMLIVTVDERGSRVFILQE